MSIAEKLTTIAENEQKVYDAGFKAGKSQGGGGDAEAAFEAGKKAQYDEFWDNFQNNGNLKNYKSVFAGRGWKQEVFYPKYDIIATNAVGTFQEFGGTSFNLVQRLEECGVTLDVSNATLVGNLFMGTPFTEVPHIDTKNATSLGSLYQNSSYLTKASIALKDDGSQTWQNSFSSCKSLVDFTITSGAIGQNGFNIKDSTKLSKASILSILNACNIDVIGKGISITLPSKCIDGATDTEALMSENGDVDLYGAKMVAYTYGYNIVFA